MADLITYEKFPDNYLGGLELDKDTNSSKNQTTVYVSSSSWWAQVTIDKNWGTWGRSFTLWASYWNGATWVEAWKDTHSWGQFESGSWTYKYYHNSTLGSTSGDVPTAVLWELHLDHPELYRKRLWVYAGGAGCMPRSTYDNFYRGKPVYCSGRMTAPSSYNAGDNGRTRDEALSIFNRSFYSGKTQIPALYRMKLVANKYC